MRRVIPILILVFGVIIAVMIYLVATFDIKAHKERLVAFISEGIDRDVRVDGKIGLELSLNPTIVAEHVRIGNPSWATIPGFIEATHVEVQFALLPLFGKKIKILKFRTTGASVDLEKNREGVLNWRMRWRGRLTPRIKLLPDIPNICVENSIVTFHGEHHTDRILHIKALQGNLTLYKPFKLTGDVMFRGLPIHLSLTAERLANGEKPSLRITLENTAIDLSKYIAQTDKPNPEPTEMNSASNIRRRIIPNFVPDENLLNSLSVDVQISDLKVMYGEELITTIDTRLSIADGKLLLSPWHSRSPAGSSTKARFLWDTSESPSRAELSVDMEGLDYGLILNNLDIRDDIIGKLDMRMTVEGYGSSFYDYLGTANGDLEIVLDKGRTPRRLLELWSDGLIRLLIPTAWFEGDLTDLNCGVGRFDIKNGIIRSNLLLSDTPRITVAGETMLNLKTEEVSCLFKPKNKEATLIRYGRPIKISGTLSDLKAETVGSNIVALGKLALGISYPASIILLFGDLGTTERNPCEALLYQELPEEDQALRQ